MKTGYFANWKHSTKVHLVDENDKPVCGSKIGDNMDYQWVASTPQIGYIDCKKCRDIFFQIEKEKLEKLAKTPVEHFEI